MCSTLTTRPSTLARLLNFQSIFSFSPAPPPHLPPALLIFATCSLPINPLYRPSVLIDGHGKRGRLEDAFGAWERMIEASAPP